MSPSTCVREDGLSCYRDMMEFRLEIAYFE